MKRTMRIAALMLIAVLTCCCNCSKDGAKQPGGTLDGPVTMSPAPEKVHQAMPLAYIDRYENVFRDSLNGVSIWSLVNCNPGISSDGYGIHVNKDKVVTCFPDIYHGKNPHAWFDASSGQLWLVCGVMEGTGVEVEKPYLIRFNEDDTAFIAAETDPYAIQELIRKRLGYRICGNRITLFDGGNKIACVKNTVKDMGGFDSDNPVWVGEQIRFEGSGSGITVVFTPGIKFTTGLVLAYDDMPDLRAEVTLDGDGNVTIGDVSVCEAPNPSEPQ